MEIRHLIRFQAAHAAWALGELLRHAGTLPVERLDEDLGIGPGSLRENLAHTIECMFFFADNFGGRAYAEPADFREGSRSLAGLAGLLARADESLRAAMIGACEHGHGERVPWPNAEGGTMPAAAAISQVFDHSTLHRAQCVNILKRLGVRPVPDLDPMSFLAMGMPW